ncbi:MAG: hypothetical protein QOK05_2873 [Chloroflexota bacterium]|nr:hypothetical protein [Chloroflexota bacterium]
MVDEASASLGAGLDAPSLMALALLDRHDVRREEVSELAGRAFGELGIEWPTVRQAVETLLRETATKIVEGSLGPYDGARHIWDLSRGLNDPLVGLDTFVYAASEWYDRPEMQLQFAQAVVDAARVLATAD